MHGCLNRVQDDDYLIPPNVIHAMLQRSIDVNDPTIPIHLLSPEDHLNSILSRISDNIDMHTSYAWLGYGTLTSRATITAFANLMINPGGRSPYFLEDERRMADNYFAILSNHIPEIWIDKGHPLAPDNAFTVGAEGDDRNWKYFVSLPTQSLLAVDPDSGLDSNSLLNA